ncbi:glyceraldehyde-3-phosphate dehydrogenase/erythrose-4-phosphate dehydrogenase [Oceanisphaera litoralis]|uniref:hypothetical protein n=1 Tax=Oceanisphaera litoralis TaxID=225144 RepID=UPI001EF90F01|nr:hypothetical protein [Oceanisphaera litoralis]MBM7454856.1 glyceraldehyde-3-phosphate dehydrogenase/erythrose-4-phosphate dehydrogenase [Oceanisphaera litoralis]
MTSRNDDQSRYQRFWPYGAVGAQGGQSLIPTTTGSATASTHIFPELKGKLNGHAVRVPLAKASLTLTAITRAAPVLAAGGDVVAYTAPAAKTTI